MHPSLLQRDREGGFLTGGDDGIARDKASVTLTSKRDVAGRMAWRWHPEPARHPRHLAAFWKGLQDITHINRVGRVKRATAANRRISRRVEASTVQVRHVQRMHVNGYIPLSRKRIQRVHMVKMAVRHHDGDRSRPCPKSLRRRTFDTPCRAAQARIRQNPAPIPGILWPQIRDIYDSQSQIGQSGGDGLRQCIAAWRNGALDGNGICRLMRSACGGWVRPAAVTEKAA